MAVELLPNFIRLARQHFPGVRMIHVDPIMAS